MSLTAHRVGIVVNTICFHITQCMLLFLVTSTATMRLFWYFTHFTVIYDTSMILQHDIETVVENSNCRIYWKYAFPTTTRLQANKPDMVLLVKQNNPIYVIEFSASAETNIGLRKGRSEPNMEGLLAICLLRDVPSAAASGRSSGILDCESFS